MNTRRVLLQGALLAGAATLLPPSLGRASADELYGPEADAAFPVDGKAPAGTIDWHNHWSSPRASALQRTVGGHGDGDGGGGFTHPKAYTDIDARIEHLDSVGVERQVISLGSGPDSRLSADIARQWCTLANEDLAEVVRQHPTRFSGYAAVPTQDIDFAVEEVERGYRDLGLIGAVLPIGAVQSRQGASQVSPILDTLQKRKGILYLHSGPASANIVGQKSIAAPREDAYTLRARYEKAAGYARGLTTLTQTDFLDPYPDVTVIVAMLGGVGPYLFAAHEPLLKSGMDGEPIRSLSRVYLDASVSRTPKTLELVVSTFGADRILFGTDFGVWPSIAPIVSAVHRSSLTDVQKNKLFVDNGQQIFAAKGHPVS